MQQKYYANERICNSRDKLNSHGVRIKNGSQANDSTVLASVQDFHLSPAVMRISTQQGKLDRRAPPLDGKMAV